MNKEKATKNGNGNNLVAQQLSILGSNNVARKLAYVKGHNIVTGALEELFRAHNIKVATVYLQKFAVVPKEVATACVRAGRASLLKGMNVA